MAEGAPDSVTSKDGTRIAFWRYGQGPPLLVVHGTTADHTRWPPAIPALSATFMVCAMDRRGRGGSGDVEPYALEREFEDVAAVVDSFDEPGNLLGHSYGAICSLEALRRTGNARKLVLYEPPIPTGTPMYPPGAIERMQARLDAGDRERVAVAFFQDVVRMPAHELEMFRTLPVWAALVAAAHTIPREMRASMEYRFDPQAFRAVATPALLLLGGSSPPFLKAGTEAVKDALRHNRLVVMPGQQHAAIDTATGLFTSPSASSSSHAWTPRARTTFRYFLASSCEQTLILMEFLKGRSAPLDVPNAAAEAVPVPNRLFPPAAEGVLRSQGK